MFPQAYILRAMKNCQKLNFFRLNAVHDSVIAEKNLPDILIVRFWNSAAAARKFREHFNNFYDFCNKPGRIIFRVFLYVRFDVFKVGYGGGSSFNSHQGRNRFFTSSWETTFPSSAA